MHKRGIAVLLLFMAAAFLHAGKHTNFGAKISFDFGARTLEEVSALYDELLDILGTSYKLEERYEPRRDSYFHWFERWTYLDRSNRLDGQDFAILMNFHAGQKSPFPYMRKSSVQGSLCFEEFFVLLDERPSTYYAFQRNVMLKIMTFAEKNGIGITGFERTNFIFNSGPLPYFGPEIHFDFNGRADEEALNFYEKLADNLSHKYTLVYKELDFRGNYSCLFSNGWDMKSIRLRFSPRSDETQEDAFVSFVLYKNHTESAAETMAAYRDFQKGMLLAIKSFAEERNVKVMGCSSGEQPMNMDFMAGASY